jgi:diguanylate cyclase (GGDEF)-like protein
MSLFSGLFTRMDMFVLEYNHANQFIALNNIPDWLEQIQDQTLDSNHPLPILEIFPFIEHFLEDAEAFWKKPNGPRLASGLWTEADNNGAQHQLEAYAIGYENKRILLIVDVTKTFDARHQVFQRAREIALAQEKLIVSLQRQQRQLQVDLQFLLTQNTPITNINDWIKEHTSAVMICKPDGRVELLNKSLMDIYPASLPTDPNHPPISILNQWISEAKQYYPEIERILETGSYWEGEFTSVSGGNEERLIRLIISPVASNDDQIKHIVCIANDITDIHEPLEGLDKVTEYDFITQLPNRRQFWRVLTESIDECRLNSHNLILFYFDLDRFKHINDSFDHSVGDKLLAATSSRLKANIKGNDFVAHLGGDEFAVLMKASQASVDINLIGQRLLKAIRQPVQIAENIVHVTASLGIATCTEQNRTDATTLMRNADLAMYHAKRSGRNKYYVYTEELSEAFANRSIIQRDMTTALLRGEMFMVYQPQVSLSKDVNLRIEALLRWHHPEQGMISPATLIPIAEETNFINVLGRWILEQSCIEAMRLLQTQSNVIVAVNISVCQLRSADFIQSVKRALQKSGLPASCLELELTESVLLEGDEQGIELLQEIRSLGISIALDDFGSGFSSLNYLKNLPIDIVKIDRSFIKDIESDENNKKIISSIVTLAHDLNLKVIAEGVETEEQLNYIREIQCDYVQGYYFYRPMSATDIKSALDKTPQPEP